MNEHFAWKCGRIFCMINIYLGKDSHNHLLFPVKIQEPTEGFHTEVLFLLVQMTPMCVSLTVLATSFAEGFWV